MGKSLMDATLAFALLDKRKYDSNVLALRASFPTLRASPPWTAANDVFCFW